MSKPTISNMAHVEADDFFYRGTGTTYTSIKDTLGDVYRKPEMDVILAEKSDTDHVHDDRYYTEEEADTLLAGKSDTGHTHDDRYYTEAEVGTLLGGKSDTDHTHTLLTSIVNLDGDSETDGFQHGLVASGTIPAPNSWNTMGLPVGWYHVMMANQDSAGKERGITFASDSDVLYYRTLSDSVYGALQTVSVSGHTHDGRYYTESEVDTELAKYLKWDLGSSRLGLIGVNGGYSPLITLLTHDEANAFTVVVDQSDSDKIKMQQNGTTVLDWNKTTHGMDIKYDLAVAGDLEVTGDLTVSGDLTVTGSLNASPPVYWMGYKNTTQTIYSWTIAAIFSETSSTGTWTHKCESGGYNYWQPGTAGLYLVTADVSRSSATGNFMIGFQVGEGSTPTVGSGADDIIYGGVDSVGTARISTSATLKLTTISRVILSVYTSNYSIPKSTSAFERIDVAFTRLGGT